MADNSAVPAAPDVAPAGGNVDSAQEAAVAAAEAAISRNDAGAGGDNAATNTTGGDRGGSAGAPRVEDLADAEDRHSRGLDFQSADDAGEEAAPDVDDVEAEAADEAVEDELSAEQGDDPAVDEADAAEGEAEADADAPSELEQRAEYVPEDPSDYELPLVEGQSWTDGDKDAWSSFNEIAHQHNLPQGTLDAIGAWYVEWLATVKETFKKLDADHAKAARATLSEAFGDDAAATIATANAAYKSGLPKEFRALLRETRLPNGRKLINEPAFVTMMATLSKALAPSVDSRLDTIREMMRTNRDKYFALGLDKELLELETRKANGSASAGAALVHDTADDQRIAELQHVLRTDRDRYFRENLDQAYLKLLQKREAKRGRAA